MSKSLKRENDHVALAELEKFHSATEVDPTSYGLTPEESVEMGVKLTAFDTKLTEHTEVQAHARGVTDGKNLVKDEAIDYRNFLAEKIQIDPKVTDEQREDAGVHVRDKHPSHISPEPCTDCKVIGKPDSTNEVYFHSTNKPGALYVVEGMFGDETEFRMVDVIKQTKYIHHGVTVGQKATYRIVTRRGKEYSSPSNEAVVYAD